MVEYESLIGGYLLGVATSVAIFFIFSRLGFFTLGLEDENPTWRQNLESSIARLKKKLDDLESKDASKSSKKKKSESLASVTLRKSSGGKRVRAGAKSAPSSVTRKERDKKKGEVIWREEEEEMEEEPHAQIVSTPSWAAIPKGYPELTDQELAALQDIKEALGEVYTREKELWTDRDLLRFVRARKYNTANAKAMILNFIKWRDDFGALNLTFDHAAPELAKHKAIFHGFDKAGRPTVVVFARRHDPSDRDVKSVMRAVVYSLDLVIKNMIPPTETFASIIDFEGFSTLKPDLALAKECITVMELAYPERLGIVYLINNPWGLSTIWNVVKPWLDPVTAKKILFLDNKKKLLDHFDPDCLLTIHGGTSNFDPSGPYIGLEMSTPESWDPTKRYKEGEDYAPPQSR